MRARIKLMELLNFKILKNIIRSVFRIFDGGFGICWKVFLLDRFHRFAKGWGTIPPLC